MFTKLRFLAVFSTLAIGLYPGGHELVAQEEVQSVGEGAFLAEIEVLVNEGVYQEAIRRLEVWLREYPEDVEARRLISRSYHRTGGAFRLRHHAKILSREFPDDVGIQSWLMDADAIIEVEYPKALAELETALANDPENKNLRRELIELYLLGERKDDAVREFRVLLAEDPENPELLLEFARNLSWMDRLEESLAGYRRYIELIEEPPAAIRLELARVYAWNVQYREAVAILNDILDANDNDLDARVLLGDIYRWNDDSVESEAYYSYVLDRDPEHPDALAGLRALEDLERSRDQASGTLSIPEMERRVREDPEDAPSVKQLARLYAAKNHYDLAIRTYEQYFQLRPDDLPTRKDYAFCLSMEEHYDTAIAQLRRYLHEFPEDITVKLDIIRLLMWSSRYELAKRELLAIVEFSELYPEIVWQLARIEHIRGNWVEAIEFYSELKQTAPQFNVAQAYIREIESNPSYQLARLQARVAEVPEDTESRLELAVIYLDAKRFWEAREQGESVLRYSPGHVEAERIIGWADLGLEELRYERLREMRARLREDPDDFEAILEIARILRLERNYEDSVRFYRAYLQQMPEDHEALEEYAMALYWLPGREEVAVQELRRLLDFRSGDIELHVLYLELVDRSDGLDFEDFETIQAIEAELDYMLLVNPDNAQPYYWLGRLSQLRDRNEEALELYAHADNLLPAEAELKATIAERVDSLVNTPDHRIESMLTYAAENPGDLEVLFDLAVLQYDLGRFYEARETASRILEAVPGDAQAQDLFYASERNIEELRAENMLELRASVAENPRDMEGQLELARLLRQEGAYEEARERYRLYLRSYPAEIDVRREYAEMLSWTEEHREEAYSELAELADLYPHDYEFQLQVARAMSWDRRYWIESETRLERLARLVGEDPEILLIQADLHRFQGRLNEAAQLYDRVLEMTGHTPSYYSDRYEGYGAVEPYDYEYAEEVAWDSTLPPVQAGYYYDPSARSVEDEFTPRSEVPQYVEPNYDPNGEEYRAVYEDPYLSPLYYREPAVYESYRPDAVPEERMLDAAYSRHQTTTRVMVAQTQNNYGSAGQSSDFESSRFRSGGIQAIEGGAPRAGFGAEEDLVISTGSNGVEAYESRTDYRRVPSVEVPERVERGSFLRSHSDIPEVSRPGLNESFFSESNPVSFRRRDVVESRSPERFDRFSSVRPSALTQSTRSRFISNEVAPTERPNFDRESRYVRAGLNEARSVDQERPMSRFQGSQYHERYQRDPREFRAEPTREIDPFAERWDRQRSPIRSAPRSIAPSWERERGDQRRGADVAYRGDSYAPRSQSYRSNGGDQWLYADRPFYPAAGEPAFASSQNSYRDRSYREVAPSRQWTATRENRGQQVPLDRYREAYVEPRNLRREYRSPSRSERLPNRYGNYSRNVYDPRAQRRYSEREYPRYAQQRPSDAYVYDAYGNLRPLERTRYNGSLQVDRAPSEFDQWRRLREDEGLVLAGNLRNDGRLYAPVDRAYRSGGRRVITAPPPAVIREERPRIRVAPVASVGTYRQFGDNVSSNSRIQPRVTNLAASGNMDYAARAEAGMRSIQQQLRPRVSFFYGAEADTDDFTGHRIGGRYSHYLRDGTRWDLGLTYHRYEETSGLSVNQDAEATMLSVGVSAPLGDRLTGSAELKLTDFSIGPDFTLTGGVGATYAVDTVNTISLDYENYDAVHAVKTVRSLEEEIAVDRVTLAWNSNPVANVMEQEFWKRIHFEGNISFASYSDDNSETSFLIRPYFRVMDIPRLDLVVGWRSISLDRESPSYWSPDSYSGPLFGLRLSGETVWDMVYEIRGEIFFPVAEETSRSLSLDLRKNFTDDLTAGANFFISQSPRSGDSTYNYYGLLLDVLYRF